MLLEPNNDVPKDCAVGSFIFKNQNPLITNAAKIIQEFALARQVVNLDGKK